MLQLGMRAHDFAPAMPAEPFIDGLSKANIRQIQLAFEKSFSDLDVSTGHYSAGLAQYISGLLHEKHVHCAVLGCYINPVVPDEALRKKEVERFVERLRYAKHMGADMVGTETGRFSIDFSVTEKTNSEECYRVLLESFSKICAAAEALGVTVGVEGVFDHTLSNPKKMQRFLKDLASPSIEVILDFANLLSPQAAAMPGEQERLVNEAFERYGDRISVLHLKDCIFDANGVQQCVAPGTGLVDFQPLMKLIKKEKPYIVGLLEESSAERFAADCAFFQNQWEMA